MSTCGGDPENICLRLWLLSTWWCRFSWMLAAWSCQPGQLPIPPSPSAPARARSGKSIAAWCNWWAPHHRQSCQFPDSLSRPLGPGWLRGPTNCGPESHVGIFSLVPQFWSWKVCSMFAHSVLRAHFWILCMLPVPIFGCGGWIDRASMRKPMIIICAFWIYYTLY